MRITLDTKVIESEGLLLGEFLALLIPYHGYTYQQCSNAAINRKLASPALNSSELVLSENMKKRITEILVKSSDKLRKCNLNFEDIAKKLQECYPKGNKPGSTHLWRGNIEDVMQKLRILVGCFDFDFTEEEAINATKEYVKSFKEEKYMALLPYFILRVEKDANNDKIITSSFMTMIENKRENNE